SAFKIAAIGFGTARALKKYYVTPDFVPKVSTVKGLATELVEKYDWSHATVVRVQGNLSDSTVPDALSKAGAKVMPMEVYRTYFPEWPVGFKRKLLQTPPNAILFSSGSTAEGLRALLSDEEFTKVTAQAQIVSIGPSTTRVIESHGLKVTIQARRHSVPGLVQELVEFYQS
ncbi:MAG: uroporphyrinogen-III synthase, partial [candidate division Zixibacteria bacterium]|nr:uroporphyrinogen-III synthase [candidate division Zixibacteria bacterium]